ncbi:MAG: NAD(P)H-hydrate dehydratase [Candidatus Margulisbacteria bacterium]|nr:NAD(P)H-hydrate dehydratase [Candidatus Margulisiibacteriota bacterium]
MKLPTRSQDTHKGECGRVVIIAGSRSMIGAAILASLAALRSGAGLVHLFTVGSAVPQINITYPELIVHLLPDQEMITKSSLTTLISICKKINPDAIAIGPGMGRDPQTQSVIHEIFTTLLYDKKSVIDADALHAIEPTLWPKISPQTWVLTPHAKEYEAVFGKKPEGQKAFSAKHAASDCHQIVLLKGHQTGISDGTQTTTNSTGNPGLATAGTGDVLTGIIVALMAQGLSPFEAAKTGAYLHGLAGDLAVKELGFHSLIASDVIRYLPYAFKETQALSGL